MSTGTIVRLYLLTKEIEINIGLSTKFRSLDMPMSSNMARDMLSPKSVLVLA